MQVSKADEMMQIKVPNEGILMLSCQNAGQLSCLQMGVIKTRNCSSDLTTIADFWN